MRRPSKLYDAMNTSQSLAWRRHRLSHARVRSPAQPRSRMTKPVRSQRLMIRSSVDRCARISVRAYAQHSRHGRRPWQGCVRVARPLDQARSPVVVLQIGTADRAVQQVEERVGPYVAFATFDLLTRLVTGRPARLDALQRLAVDDAALGLASRPTASRAHAASTALTASSRSLSRIWQKRSCPVVKGRKSIGTASHRYTGSHPARSAPCTCAGAQPWRSASTGAVACAA